MTPEGTRRSTRVGERVRSELMDMLLRGALRDPATQGVFISDVKMSKDLRYARVYVRLTECAKGDKERQNTIRALERATGYLRRVLAPRLKLRYVPELRFFWDEQVDRASRIDTLLEEIRREQNDREQ